MIINPTVYNGREASDIFSLNLKEKIIHLCGEINDEMAETVIAQLLYLNSQCTPGDEIQLYINSPGGSVSAGLAIYDTMQSISADVSTVCVGMAASMAAVILSGGARGRRRMLKHSEVMIHQPSGGVDGKATDMLIAADHIRRLKSELTNILAENCSQPIDKVAADIETDHWLTSAEAVEYGIVDDVI